jgi:hypothetical protein
MTDSGQSVTGRELAEALIHQDKLDLRHLDAVGAGYFALELAAALDALREEDGYRFVRGAAE